MANGKRQAAKEAGKCGECRKKTISASRAARGVTTCPSCSRSAGARRDRRSAEIRETLAANSPLELHGRVFKTGNSLAIRISSAIAKHCALEEGSMVDIVVLDQTISVRKAQSRELGVLLDRITPDNVHGEVFADFVGLERW